MCNLYSFAFIQDELCNSVLRPDSMIRVNIFSCYSDFASTSSAPSITLTSMAAARNYCGYKASPRRFPAWSWSFSCCLAMSSLSLLKCMARVFVTRQFVIQEFPDLLLPFHLAFGLACRIWEVVSFAKSLQLWAWEAPVHLGVTLNYFDTEMF